MLIDKTTIPMPGTENPAPQQNAQMQNPVATEEQEIAEALGMNAGTNQIDWDDDATSLPEEDRFETPDTQKQEPEPELEPENQELQPDADQSDSESKDEEEKDEFPYLTDKENMTKGMKKRIGKMKQREDKLRDQISQQDEMISQLRQMSLAKNQFEKIKNDDLVAIDNELTEISEKLEGAEAEMLDPVDAIKLVNKQNKAEMRKRDIQAALNQKEQWKAQSQTLRKQSDQKALELYQWVGDADSAEYHVMKQEIWPYMEAIIPDFQDMPNNVLLASMVTENHLKARLFDQQLSRKARPQNPDRIPQSNVTQTDGFSVTPASTNRSPLTSKAQVLKDMQNGKIGAGEAVMRMSGM